MVPIRSPRARALVLSLGWLGYLVHAYAEYKTDDPSDFFQSWAIGRRVAATNQPSLYTRGRHRLAEEYYELSLTSDSPRLRLAALGRRNRFEPAGTPFLYAFFSLVTTDDFERSYERYRLVCLGVYVLGLVVLLRLSGISGFASLLLVVALSEWFYPFRSDVYWSNMSAFQVGALGLVLGLRRGAERAAKNVATGAVLSALVLLKPNLMYLAALLGFGWLVDRRWRTALQVGAGAAAAGILAFAWSSFFFGGADAWREWPAAYAKIWEQYSYTNLPGLLGFKLPLATFTALGWLLALHVPFVLLARRREVEEQGLVGVGLLLYLISGSLVHAHYFILALPAAIHLLRPIASERLSERIPITPKQCLAGISMALLSMWPLLNAQPPVAYSGWAYAAVFALYAASLWDLARGRTELTG